MAVRLPSNPDSPARRRLPKRDAAGPAPVTQVIRKPPPMPPRPAPQSRARNTIPEPLVEMTRDLIRAQGFAEPRFVADFQEAKGLKIDGVIGPKTTMAAIESTPIKTFGELKPVERGWYDTYFIDLLTRTLGDDRRAREMVESILPIVEMTPGVGDAAGLAQAADLYEEGHPLLAAGAGGLTLAGAIFPPAKTLTRPAARGLESLAARVDMLDPPPQPLRPFKADYPGNVPADETGKLYRDPDGHIIRAPNVVGRQMAGGPDVPLSREEYATIIKAITGRDIRKVSASEMQKITRDTSVTFGITRLDEKGRKPVEVVILDSLGDDEYWTTVRHEFGHVVDLAAGQIPTAGLEKELRQLYGALQRVPDDPSFPITPENLGYERRGVARRELIAEAIRAYAMDPNYIKTIAPETAKAIRRWVRATPMLSKTLHFNSIAAGLVAGAAATGVLPDEAEADER